MSGTLWLRHGATLAVAVLVLPLLLAADESPTAPPKGWKEFSPKDQSFTVWVPNRGGKTSERERTVFVKGKPVKFNTIIVHPKGEPQYSASSVLLPATNVKKLLPVKEQLEIIRDGWVEESKGEVAEEKDIKQGQVPGKEYLIEGKREFVRLQVLAWGGRVYIATVSGTKDQVTDAKATQFLESYKLPAKVTEAPDKKEDK